LVDLTEGQRLVLQASGQLLVTGGPGSGKTTVSILKAASIVEGELTVGQKVLFLSFARATVSRVMEAIDEEKQITSATKKQIEVETYHSFFWRILKAHGYLLGLPRKLSILVPPNEAIALSSIRSQFKSDSKLPPLEKLRKQAEEAAERKRLAFEGGEICFNLFADYAARILHGSEKIRKLVSVRYPSIVLDEFQDTNIDQWNVVQALGQNSRLIALADPEQRIFDFIGADPERLDQFKTRFNPSVVDLSGANHRSKGTDIAIFGNDVLTGKYRSEPYQGINCFLFDSNVNQALTALTTQTLQARSRLLKSGKIGWSLAILVPTKRMTRQVSDSFRSPLAGLKPISHVAAVDMEAAILAAEVIAYCLQSADDEAFQFGRVIELVCSFYQGRGGGAPSQANLKLAKAMGAAHAKLASGKAAKKSIVLGTRAVLDQVRSLTLVGDPDLDWQSVRGCLENGACQRMKEIASEARNVRVLDRGTQLRQALSEDWRENGSYRNALTITRQAFVQEHFATNHKPETGVIVMNMHKAKGKQFDEVVIFEGWPRRVYGKIVSNPDRIIRSNSQAGGSSQARQNFRVSVTRAKIRITILTPKDDPCVLFKPLE
jgi:DNA helicase II / ATP-dependent DNA helicase PcrA